MDNPKIITRDFVLAFLSQFVFSFAFSMLIPTLPIYLLRLGSREETIGILIGVFSVSSLVLRPSVGNLLSRVPERQVMMAGSFVSGLASLAYLFALPFWPFFIVRLLQGAGYALVSTAAYTLIANIGPAGRRGQSLGYFLRQHMRWGSEPVQIVGVPNTGKPLVRGIAEVLGDHVRLLEMFKEGEGKGRIASRLTGNCSDPTRPVTLIDDMITKGGSKIEAIDVLRGFGFTVERIVVLVDRQQGGKEEMAAKSVELLASLRFSEILEGSRQLGLIDQAMYDLSVAYPAALDAAMAAHQAA